MKYLKWSACLILLGFIVNCSHDELDSNVEISSITKNKKGPINEVPVFDISGTYDCTNCGDIGFPMPIDEITIQGISNVAGSDYAVTMTYFDRVFTSSANVQTNCSKNGRVTTCHISGTFNPYGQIIKYQATHIFVDKKNEKQQCQSFEGTWEGTYDGQFIHGTMKSDNNLCE